MKWLAILMAFLASCAHDNSVQVGDYRIAYNSDCGNASAQLMWCIIIPAIVIMALYTYIRRNW